MIRDTTKEDSNKSSIRGKIKDFIKGKKRVSFTAETVKELKEPSSSPLTPPPRSASGPIPKEDLPSTIFPKNSGSAIYMREIPVKQRANVKFTLNLEELKDPSRSTRAPIDDKTLLRKGELIERAKTEIATLKQSKNYMLVHTPTEMVLGAIQGLVRSECANKEYNNHLKQVPDNFQIAVQNIWSAFQQYHSFERINPETRKVLGMDRSGQPPSSPYEEMLHVTGNILLTHLPDLLRENYNLREINRDSLHRKPKEVQVSGVLQKIALAERIISCVYEPLESLLSLTLMHQKGQATSRSTVSWEELVSMERRSPTSPKLSRVPSSSPSNALPS